MELTVQTLKEVIQKLCPNGRTQSLLKKENAAIKKQVIESTSFISDAKMPQRIWHILNNTNQIPTCPVCNNAKLKWFDYSYAATCSKSCGQKLQETVNLRKLTSLKKYGVDSPNKAESVKLKKEQTSLKNYGTTHPWKNKEILEKRTQTVMERYGVSNPSSSPQVQEKRTATFLEKYGETTPFKNATVKEAIKQKNQERYGVNYPQESEQIREITKKNNLEKYGYDYPLQMPEIKDKIRETNLKKYGVVNAGQRHLSNEVLDKLNDKDWLIKENSSKSMTQISKDLGVSNTAVFHKFSKYGIQPKHKPAESTLSNEFEEYLKTLGVKYEKNNRQILKPLEVDFYIPEHKLGFELNGGYWHSENLGKDKWYHLNKTIGCENKGIQLIHIFDFDWQLCKSSFKGKIENLLKLGHKVNARSCIVKEITTHEERAFLEENHIQKYSASKVKYGLFFKDELVSIMTFGRPRFSKHFEWELIRFASKGNYTIVGGASKLFSKFIAQHNPTSIISYGNRLFNRGNIYKILGFSFRENTSPSYRYTKDFATFHHRLSFRKSELKRKLEVWDPDKTEWQNMQDNGYFKIWDCGQSVWIWRK
jgi:hypothetical protein